VKSTKDQMPLSFARGVVEARYDKSIDFVPVAALH
jgi:hypothetical protein